MILILKIKWQSLDLASLAWELITVRSEPLSAHKTPQDPYFITDVSPLLVQFNFSLKITLFIAYFNISHIKKNNKQVIKRKNKQSTNKRNN